MTDLAAPTLSSPNNPTGRTVGLATIDVPSPGGGGGQPEAVSGAGRR
jgi:hypothetical protein